MAKNLLFITKKQFGYQTDYYKYVVYSKNEFNITYCSFDNNEKKVEEENVNLVYVPASDSYLMRGFLFLFNSIKLIRDRNFDLIMIMNFDYCFLLKLIFFRKRFILDLRTSAISFNKYKRFYNNTLTKINTFFFKNVTVISEGIARKFRLNNYKILPLGAEVISETLKDVSCFKLLYIGTLKNREIHKTIKGLKIFLDNHPDIQSLNYHIFGYGKPYEENLIKHYIHYYNLMNRVFFHGYKRHEEMKDYFDSCNVGISFVPITPYFEYQPPTKTFEYLLSGMVCIATRTHENKKIINKENGILCDDNSVSFSEALESLFKNKDSFDSETIRSSVIGYKWENIVRNKLKKIINDVVFQ